MKNKQLIVILAFLSLLAVSCAHVAFDRNTLFGSYHFVNFEQKKWYDSTFSCVLTYNPNGQYSMNCLHEMKGTKLLASYRIEEENEWYFQGDSYFERTIRQELISIKGNEELVDEIKKIYSNTKPHEWREWKIIKLTNRDFIIRRKNDEGTEITFELKKIF